MDKRDFNKHISEYEDREAEQIARKKKAYLRRKQRERALLIFKLKVCIGAGLILIVWNIFGNTLDTISAYRTSKINLNNILSEATSENKDRVSFLAVGDNIGHDRVNQYADSMLGEMDDDQYDYSASYKNVEKQIKSADIAFINQESIIGGKSLGITGYPAFNSPEELAGNLVDVGFDVVNAATNHILDKGFTGVQNAANTWAQYSGITYVGAYVSQEDADTIRTFKCNGITFSILAYTYGTNGYKVDNDFTVPWFERDKIISDVAKAKEISDVVMVSAHWGDEGSYTLNSLQQEYGQLFADQGVDLVIGHHAHTVQELTWVEGEMGNKTLIAYGLGNFLSTMESVDNQLEGMLTLDFVKKGSEIVIENILFIPLINHFGEGPVEVHYMSEYTEELRSVHYTLKDETSEVMSYYTNKLNQLIPAEFLSN